MASHIPADGPRRNRVDQDRFDRYAAVSRDLALLGDRALRDLIGESSVIGSGIGGTSMLLKVAETPVFVKCIPLTDLERQPDNVMTTANLFDLPVCCQYGVGSPSFGAWRELAANAMATSWVLAGHSSSFPLLYHWRVLDRPPSVASVSEELADIERAVQYWHGSLAVRRRIEAIVESSATVILFLEYFPLALPQWMATTLTGAGQEADSAIAMVERGLRDDIAFMNAAGLFHFDAHFGNIRTDGERLYFADFGLAMSPRFDLSADESSFLATNISHDACHTITRLVDWLVTELAGEPYRVERDDFIRRCADGYEPAGVLPAAVATIKRYAPIAIVINEFYRRLHLEDRNTPYPVAEVEKACGAAGFEGPWSR